MHEKSDAEDTPRRRDEVGDADVRPDSWERFEHAVAKAARAPPLHRPAKQVPTPAERPDIYDDYDCKEGPSTYPAKSAEAVIPEHVKAAKAARSRLKPN